MPCLDNPTIASTLADRGMSGEPTNWVGLGIAGFTILIVVFLFIAVAINNKKGDEKDERKPN